MKKEELEKKVEALADNMNALTEMVKELLPKKVEAKADAPQEKGKKPETKPVRNEDKKPKAEAQTAESYPDVITEEKAELYLKKYAKAKAEKEEANKQMKIYEAELKRYAESNPQLFEESNTLKMTNGAMAWLNNTKMEFPVKTHDIAEFAKSYPKCVDIKLKVSAVKGLLNDAGIEEELRDVWEIEIWEERSFQVAV